MHAIVRESTFDVAALEKGQAQLDEFQALHARQNGYAGTLVVELAPGRWLTVNLWSSADAASAALPTMGPAVGRLLEPMMAAPSQIIGAGRVVLSDVRKTPTSPSRS